ncbi:MAG: diacylglycerol kinase family lipid kinase [Lachnospiraceae bacterium]|nr:diacylglycerol kinase family lipid kinase [Lachnospiraceae bacterium]
MSRKLLFIYNQHAGKGQIKPLLADIINIFTKADYQVVCHPTQAPKDAIQVARDADEDVELIVCSGGDGTLDEVATGLMQRGATIPIGYIPVGTTNDFANSLNLSRDIIQAAADVVSGEPYSYDVGAFNQDNFVYVAAFGAFTAVSYETNQDFKKLFGHMAYLLEGMKSLTEIKSYMMKVDVNGRTYEGEFLFGMVTNTLSVGGFKNLTGKHVELDDGLFEVTLIHNPQNFFELQEIIGCLLTANDETDLIDTFKTDRIIIESMEEVAWTLDGEFGGEHSFVRIENCHKAMQIIVEKEEAE